MARRTGKERGRGKSLKMIDEVISESVLEDFAGNNEEEDME